MHKLMFQVLKCTIMHELCFSSHSSAKKNKLKFQSFLSQNMFERKN